MYTKIVLFSTKLIIVSSVFASHVKDEIIVSYHSQVSEKSQNKLEKLHSLRAINKFPLTNSVHYKILSDEKPTTLKYIIQKNKLVKYVSLNKSLEQNSLNLDSDFSKQWYLENTGQTIQYNTGVAGIDIGWKEAMQLYDKKLPSYAAVLDSGFAQDHDEIKDKNAFNNSEYYGVYGEDDDGNGKVDDIWGWDFYDNDPFPYDFDGHGTSISGIISGANDGVGIQGIAPDTYIYPLRVAGPWSDGITRPTLAAVVGALNYVFLQPAIRVVNLSLRLSDHNLLLSETVAKFDSDDRVLLICSAGNDNENNDVVAKPPSTLNSRCIISVASIDSNGDLSWFSNYGQNTVDIAAPGSNIYTANIENEIKRFYPLDPLSWTQTFLWSNTGMSWDNGYKYQESTSYKSPTLVSPITTQSYATEITNFLDPFELNEAIMPRIMFYLSFNLTGDSVAYLYASDSPFGPFEKKYTFSGNTSMFEFIDISFDEFTNSNGIYVKFVFVKRSPYDFFLIGTPALVDLDVDNYSGLPYYQYNDGTSFSAPVLAAVAAMIFSHRPDLLASDVKKIILDSSQPLNSLTGKVLSGGMVRADKAIELANTYRKRVKVSLDADIESYSEFVINPYGEVFTDGFSEFFDDHKIGELKGAGWFFEGDKIKVSATESNGWLFNNWNSNPQDTYFEKEINLSNDINLVAHFRPDWSDLDNDSLSGITETLIGTDPQNEDSDGDSISDGDEVTANSLNPTVDDSLKIDSLNSIFGKESFHAGQSSVLNNLSTYNLVTQQEYNELQQTMGNTATPYTPDWFFIPNHGWMWSEKDVYPYFYDSKTSNWMYFQSGNEKPRFFHYGTKKWMTVE